MKIEYKYYGPNQGLEGLQAKLYNEASGQSTTEKELEEIHKSRDPKMMRYALTSEEKLLNIVTARKSKSQPERVYINYPCAVSECATEVQETIFNELNIYLTNKESQNQYTRVRLR